MKIWGIYAFTDNENQYQHTRYFLDKEDAWRHLRQRYEEKNEPMKFEIYPLEVTEHA